MPQIEFDGQGTPIPTIALPPFGSDSDLPPTVVVINESREFTTSVYRDLGFTHFEVWCVGAAGGRGGDILEAVNNDPAYSAANPISRISYGGEGGGGGLHFAAGLLADLPDSVPVVVGQVGSDGQDGNPAQRWFVAVAMQDFAGAPQLLAVTKGAKNLPGMVDANGNAIAPYFYTAQSSYLYYPNPYYVAPQDGHDGGYSSFNETVCQASGGTGGKKTPVYRNDANDNDSISAAYQNGPGGNGGEGGSGGRILVGGGGLGATASDPEFWGANQGHTMGEEKPRIFTPPQDGTWDGTVGKGGGGGRGGSWRPEVRFTNGGGFPAVITPATSGGNGAFSYGDTSVYGNKGVYTDYKGLGTIIPGSGGGARVQSKLRYGSKASGYSPNGVVVVRLTRIV